MKAQSNWKSFLDFALKVIVAHTATYFIFGIIMSNVFDYGEIFQRPIIRDYMIPMDEHNIVLGPFLQPVRGLIFISMPLSAVCSSSRITCLSP
jgi:hypothetical protein